MKSRYEEMIHGQSEDYRMEIENRIRNLFWTVSGDYSIDIAADVAAFLEAPKEILYEAIKQGAFSRYFDMDQLSLYTLKKIHSGADESQLLALTRLCVDVAVYPRILAERKGIADIRKDVFTRLLAEKEPASKDVIGQAGWLIMSAFLSKDTPPTLPAAPVIKDRILTLAREVHTEDIIETIDAIYNDYFESPSIREHSSLEKVLSIAIRDIAPREYRECIDEDQMDVIMRNFLRNVRKNYLKLKIHETAQPRYQISEDGRKKMAPASSKEPDPAAVKKISDFVDLNYGKSYLSPLDEQRMIGQLCRGIHSNCRIHCTEGILHGEIVRNNAYRFTQMQYEKNRMYYYNYHRIVKKNIRLLTDALRKSLLLRSDDDIRRYESGILVPSRLWKLGRTSDQKLFNKVQKAEESDFIIDILLDCSGSQAKRQSQVAIQGFIISEALSDLDIPHRVTGFNSFWGHTILQRYRDYRSQREDNLRIFEYRASGDNRDGLAIRGTCHSLLQQKEEHKILIVLSDGRPMDVHVAHPGLKNIIPYDGEEAVFDTASEIRRARSAGIAVLGIFAGSADDVMTEKKIYGKDFAYIRNIANFSRIVGSYLIKQIENTY